jgi:hypothetical protein
MKVWSTGGDALPMVGGGEYRVMWTLGKSVIRMDHGEGKGSGKANWMI